jgi:glycosyltransferase involved in cell wall biosynthesis
MSTKKVLVCAPLMPEYDRESGSRRIYDLITFLREAGHAVSFVAQNACGGGRYEHELRQLGVTTYAGFNSQTDELMVASRFDLAIFAFWHIAEWHLPYIRRVSPNTRVIIDSIDLHFVRNARRIFHRQPEGDNFGLLDSEFASEMTRELNIYAASDGVLTVSNKEADLINDLTGDATLARAVPDCEEIEFANVPFSERKGMLFIGNFRHPPNVEAVEYLCKEILPHVPFSITAEHPIYIVGNALSDKVRSYANGLPNVQMIGWVPSVMPYLHSARISIIPLLYGAGTKRKLIQALMVGTPTVSTGIGVEGLNLRDGEHVLVADDARDFAESIARLLSDKALWQRLVKKGREHITPLHGRKAARERFSAVIAEVLSKKPKSARMAALTQDQHQNRVGSHYKQEVQKIQSVVSSLIPQDAKVVVVSKGDEELLSFDGRHGWHFPQTQDGTYAGHYPADSTAAISHLESLRIKGGHYLLIPNVSSWWLDHYTEFAEHVNKFYPVAHQGDDCLIFNLCDYPGQASTT